MQDTPTGASAGSPALLRRRWPLLVVAVALVAAGFYAWREVGRDELSPDLARGNGRIEATEVDIATKIPGRIREILANEGDFVRAGDVLARMDTTQLEAQRRQAQAQLDQAITGVATARSMVAQRQAERAANAAQVTQRQTAVSAAGKRLARSEQLAKTGFISAQVLDDDRAALDSATALVSAAQAQLAASDAAINATLAQVTDAESAVAAARAALDAVTADLVDATLLAPRDGRVQYRVAQAGEVLAAGGRVLNLVDLSDVYMTFYLPTAVAGRVAIGSEARLVLDAAPGLVIPATITFVADVAQFTPKTVETQDERMKLMFRVKAQIPPELLRKHITQVKTGLPGVAYVRVDPAAPWPERLQGKLVQ